MIPITEDEPEVRAARRVRATEPAKCWRNRWRTDKQWESSDGYVFGPGEYLSRFPKPSKDVAEEKAVWFLQTYSRWFAAHDITIKYLGAEPSP